MQLLLYHLSLGQGSISCYHALALQQGSEKEVGVGSIYQSTEGIPMAGFLV